LVVMDYFLELLRDFNHLSVCQICNFNLSEPVYSRNNIWSADPCGCPYSSKLIKIQYTLAPNIVKIPILNIYQLVVCLFVFCCVV